MVNKPDSKSPIYQITVQGKLDASWQIWFANFSFSVNRRRKAKR